MSALPPPSRKREPLTKSAPLHSAATNRGISAGSVEPSASIMTMMSPVQAANPARSASPLPRPVCMTMRDIGPQRTRDLDGVVGRSGRRR